MATSLTEAAFDAAEHEDLTGDKYDSIEEYNCPACGGRHRYHNGRPTFAPVRPAECSFPGCDERARSIQESTCSNEHERAMIRASADLLTGEVNIDDFDDLCREELRAIEAEFDRTPAKMQDKIDALRMWLS